MKIELIIITSIVGFSILSTGCASKKCVGKEAHEGLMNALMCNYDLNIQELTLKLDEKTLERNRLFNNFQRLIAKVTNKKGVINQLDQEIKTVDGDLTAINQLVQKMNNNSSNTSAITIVKLKQKLKKLNMDILNKSTFFDLEDAEFTKNELLTKDDLSNEKYARAYIENTSNEKYAKAYNENTSNEKYAKAYNENTSKEKYAKAYKENIAKERFAKAYNEDIEKNREIKVALANKIKNLSDSINSSNIKESKATLASILKDAQRYNNSLKSS
jgi:hypothetical protein